MTTTAAQILNHDARRVQVDSEAIREAREFRFHVYAPDGAEVGATNEEYVARAKVFRDYEDPRKCGHVIDLDDVLKTLAARMEESRGIDRLWALIGLKTPQD